MKEKAKITFHGELGKFIGKTYELSVSSAHEALKAVDHLSGRKLTKYFLKGDNFYKEYRILINGKELAALHDKLDTKEKIQTSEVVVSRSNIKTIDIIPVIRGGNDNIMAIFTIILAVALIIGGILVTGASFGGAGPIGVGMIVAGIGLLAAGISVLLMKPPEIEEYKNLNNNAGARSYTFSGPLNTVGENVPVPFGYGRVLIGSRVIDSTYETIYADADANYI